MSSGTVLYLGGFELPDKNAAAHRVVNNAKILRELGYTVVFSGVEKGQKKKTETLAQRRKLFFGFECYQTKYPENAIEWVHQLTSTQLLLTLLEEYPDVCLVILYNFPAVATIGILRICRRRGIQIVADCTEWYTSGSLLNPISWLKSFDTMLRMRFLNRKVDGVIAISTYLASYYSPRLPVLLVPPLVDRSDQKWQKKEIAPGNPRLFVYAGSTGVNKDKIHLVFRSLVKNKDVRPFLVIVVGIGKEQFLENFPQSENWVGELGSSIKFLGRVSHEESLEVLKSADFSLIVRESTRANNAGFPTKFVESISAGIPVLATDTSDLKAYIEDYQLGFLIDMDTLKGSHTKFETILRLSDEDIHRLKLNCTAFAGFDYRIQEERFRFFLKTISGGKNNYV